MLKLNKKIIAGLLCCFMLASSGFALATEDQPIHDGHKQEYKMELTKKQQKKVAPYVEKMFKSKKEMIKKYMEVGALDKELGEKMLQKVDEKHEKMKNEGYSLYCPHHHKMHHHKE